MGGQLGKSKNVSISGKPKEHEKEVITIPNGTTSSEDIKQAEKKIKKYKIKTLNRKSSMTTVDKSTSTDGCVVSSSSSIKKLVGGYGYATNNNLSYDADTVEANVAYSSETPSKDVLEFRDACFRRGIISGEMNTITVPILIEQNDQENNLNTVEESTNETTTTTTTVVTDNDQVQNEQQEHVES